MAKKFLTPLDMTGLEIQNFRVQNNNGIPSTNVSEGRLIFNSSSSSKKLTYYNGTQWVELDAGVTIPKTSTTPIMNGTAAIGSETAYAAGDHVHPTDTSRAPTSHASSATTYGKGTASDYGHLKLSDSFTSTSSTSGGIAATPKAVNDAYNNAILDVQEMYGDVDTSISPGSTSTNLPTSAAVATFVSDQIGAVDAMRFKGTIGTGGDVSQLPTSGVKVGDTYRVITAGTYAGQTCEVGDLIIAIATTPTWTVAQTNIDGAITAAGTGLSKSGSTINHSNSVTAKTTQALYPIAFDAQGHITGSGTAITNATTSTAGLMSATDKAFLDDLETSGFLEFGKHTFNSSVLGTSTTISKNVLAYSAYDNVTKEEVVLDVEKSGTNSTTFSVAQAYSNAIVIYYVYTEASL